MRARRASFMSRPSRVSQAELLVRLVELPDPELAAAARAVCAFQRAFRRWRDRKRAGKKGKKGKKAQQPPRESPEAADTAAMALLESEFPGEATSICFILRVHPL
jgi:hypothetical protein